MLKKLSGSLGVSRSIKFKSSFKTLKIFLKISFFFNAKQNLFGVFFRKFKKSCNFEKTKKVDQYETIIALRFG
jgi:hypothetical protein